MPSLSITSAPTPPGGMDHSIGICYEGGLDEEDRPADTRTYAPKVCAPGPAPAELKTDYPHARILGHCQLSPYIRKDLPVLRCGGGVWTLSMKNKKNEGERRTIMDRKYSFIAPQGHPFIQNKFRAYSLNMSSAIFREEYFSSTRQRPLRPMVSNSASDF